MRKMKFYITGLLILGTISTVFSQEERKVALSFTVSPSVAWLESTNKGYEKEGNLLGVTYGLLADFRLFGVDNYSITTGLTMNHTGGKMKEPSYFKDQNDVVISAMTEAKYKLTYVDVPLAIRLKTNEIGYNVFYGVFGSELGVNINASKTFVDTYTGSSMGEYTDDVSGDVNLFRSSLIFGAGIQRHISGKSFYRIGITYHNGLTNIFDKKALLVDYSNGVASTVIDKGAAIEDRKLATKLKYVELNLSIMF